VVTDESGAVLPGVTVTVTSPSLQVPSMTSVTDAKGEFRITPLPIGTYMVEYSLSGFQGVHSIWLSTTILRMHGLSPGTPICTSRTAGRWVRA
jgi:Carboxypeptidase regulatory-like domain